jgi:Winged helix DNA-binding domain
MSLPFVRMSDDASAPEVPRWSWDQVLGRRLERQSLDVPWPYAGPTDIAGRLGAVHAQVLSAAELSIGLRGDGLTRTDVRDALWNERSLIKTYGPRGTVHLLPTRELPLWTRVLSTIPPALSGHPEGVRLTSEQTEQVIGAIAAALSDVELTVDELGEAVVAATGPWAGELSVEAFQGKWPRWRLALPMAGMRGAMCFGPNRGRNVTYTDPRRWMPGFTATVPQSPKARTAVADVLRRYLDAYGPATSEQFAQWLAAPQRWAAELFKSLVGELQEVDVDGASAWVAAGDTAVPTGPPRSVRLLPYFDAYAYLLSGEMRARLYRGRAAERVVGNRQVLVVDGVVAGLWHQRRSGRRLEITVEPLDPLTNAQRRELDDQVERVGQILEAKTSWAVGTVAVGSHA